MTSTQLQKAPQAGDVAPDFTARSTGSTEVSRAYGVLNDEKFYSKRAYFLIDKQGIVRWSHIEEHGGLRRNNAELLDEVAKLS